MRRVESYGLNQHPHAAEAYSARTSGLIPSRKLFGFLFCERRAVRPTCPCLSGVAEKARRANASTLADASRSDVVTIARRFNAGIGIAHGIRQSRRDE